MGVPLALTSQMENKPGLAAMRAAAQTRTGHLNSRGAVRLPPCAHRGRHRPRHSE